MIIIPQLVPNREIITDANIKNGLYVTAKEDIYPIGGGAGQVYVNATVRLIRNSREIQFPFSILTSDSLEESMKKTYLNPPVSDSLEKRLLKIAIFCAFFKRPIYGARRDFLF